MEDAYYKEEMGVVVNNMLSEAHMLDNLSTIFSMISIPSFKRNFNRNCWRSCFHWKAPVDFVRCFVYPFSSSNTPIIKLQ
ncbi:hypothetical protein NC653_002406 [Populus alba x Populus x berolinensis]|uniref:Uncharacterized protein n=1 Tax=Populus alba x Populus x berolinensis TaxID=444605 RepID=A0AAD6RQG6_9ROSI|nr:hypothetical protein NC653_002406 [Populus alba x Populus x berolinensis]